MRRGRFLAPWKDERGRAAVYHCVSRVVDRQFVLGRQEKEHFVRLMRLYEEFCGVRIRSYCVMSNHFHLLVEVPPRPEEGLSEGEFFRRLKLLYSDLFVAQVRDRLRELREAGDDAGVAAVREKFLYRMWDLSQFMKTLKQRFTQWFNGRRGRRGTLWEDRFKSVLVEDGFAGRVMAAYIDLNPLRAGLVRAPEDYRWCSYAQAVAGNERAREGIEAVMGDFEAFAGNRHRSGARTWRRTVAAYRRILFADGEERRRADPVTGEEVVVRRGVSREAARRVLAEGGKLGQRDLLSLKVRQFVDGLVLGSEQFVEEVFRGTRAYFSAERKRAGSRIRRCELPLFAMRDLQVRALE